MSLVSNYGFCNSNEIDNANRVQTPMCDINSTVGTTCKAKILALHPTQMAVGMIEVDQKVEAIQDMSSSELKNYKKQNPELVVIGPNGVVYIVDHHHLAAALYKAKETETYCTILENDSQLSQNDFWEVLRLKSWMYSYDENGKGPYPYTSIPNRIDLLNDDIYRSLAGDVRRAGGYDKTSQPFADFKWANFFRSRMSKSDVINNYDKSVAQGVRLSKSSEANSLPGYRGL